MNKKFYRPLAALIVVASGLLLFSFFSTNAHAALPRDCDDNSIIHCGAGDATELSQKYNENKTGDLPAIYEAYGISAADITSGKAQMGLAHKDGRVTVNGETVATNSLSIGRQPMAGSAPKTIAGKTFHNSPSSTAFKSESIATLVFFDGNGKFKAAIITSCGNPLEGTPVPPKKLPPTYKCVGLTARTIKLEDRTYAFDLTYEVTNGAVLKTVDYVFGDGQGREGVSPEEAKSITHSYAKAGSYTTVATLHFAIGDEANTVKDVKCNVSITTSPEMCPLNPSLPKGDARCAPCPIPGKEQYPKDSPLCVTTPAVTELPKTGPMDLIAGGLGLSSLVAASYYWYASRRGLLAAWLER